jgi:hypothetical protein
MRKSISNRPPRDCNGFSSLTAGSFQSTLVAPDARTPAIPFLLSPAFSTATRAAYASKTTTCRGSTVLPGIRRTQGVPMACLIV